MRYFDGVKSRRSKRCQSKPGGRTHNTSTTANGVPSSHIYSLSGAACVLPARRETRIHPMIVLRDN